jgi:hypothetical protein
MPPQCCQCRRTIATTHPGNVLSTIAGNRLATREKNKEKT